MSNLFYHLLITCGFAVVIIIIIVIGIKIFEDYTFRKKKRP